MSNNNQLDPGLAAFIKVVRRFVTGGAVQLSDDPDQFVGVLEAEAADTNQSYE